MLLSPHRRRVCVANLAVTCGVRCSVWSWSRACEASCPRHAHVIPMSHPCHAHVHAHVHTHVGTLQAVPHPHPLRKPYDANAHADAPGSARLSAHCGPLVGRGAWWWVRRASGVLAGVRAIPGAAQD